jgi:hypothetical protein
MKFRIDRNSVGVRGMFFTYLHYAFPDLLPVHCNILWDLCRGVPYESLEKDAERGEGTAFFYNITPRILRRELNKAMRLIGAKNLENVPLTVWGLYDLAWGHPTKRVIPEEVSDAVPMDRSIHPVLDSMVDHVVLLPQGEEEEANPETIRS